MLAVDDGTRSYRIPPEERGYYESSIAIIRTAVEDYRRYKRYYLLNERNKSAYTHLEGLCAFFLSETFENLSGLEDPYEFLDRLDRDVENDVANGVRRKRLKQTRLIK